MAEFRAQLKTFLGPDDEEKAEAPKENAAPAPADATKQK
jgi:hypothetical protein